MIHSLHFGSHLWLLAGLLAVFALLGMELHLARRRRSALRIFSSRAVLSISSLSRTWRVVKSVLKILGIAFICIALARPQLGFREEETFKRGLDLMFIIDTSKSMLATDLKPNRLIRAKLAIYDLMSKFEGNRVGLIAFAGEAFLQCPLTLDHGMFGQILDAVDTRLIPRGGTDLGKAIDAGVEALQSQPLNHKTLVVLTDGEDLESGALKAARAAAQAGVQIYAVGLGMPGGELIPDVGGGFVKEASGAFVHSRLDEKTLKEVASVTGGQYRALGTNGQGLEALYRAVLDKLPHYEGAERTHRLPIERFSWPLGLAALCLSLEAILGERKRTRQSADRSLSSRASAATLSAVVLLGLGGEASASVNKAEKNYHEGKFAQATEEYRKETSAHPDDALRQYNFGAAAYKSEHYTDASTALQKAVRSDRPELKQSAFYDLGNTRYRLGQKSLQEFPDQTAEQWKQSIASYDQALKLNPKDGDAQFNREFVKKKLAELEQHQKVAKRGQPNEPSKSPKQSEKQSKQEKSSPDAGTPKDAVHEPADKKVTQPGPGQPKDKEEAHLKPGQLSPSGARALLGSLRGDERLMKASGAENPIKTNDEPVERDW